VRGKLIVRHARGLPALADVKDPFDRRAILAENPARPLFADKGAVRFIEQALLDDEARAEALGVLFDARLRRDQDLVWAARVPTSIQGPRGDPAFVLANRFAEMSDLTMLDGEAVRVATDIAHTSTHKHALSLAVQAFHARGEGPLTDVLSRVDWPSSLTPIAIARFLAPRAQRIDDDDVQALVEARSNRATPDAMPSRGDIVGFLLLALSPHPARAEGCARLLDVVLGDAAPHDIAARPVLGCPVPTDLDARLDARSRTGFAWMGDGGLRAALATLYGTAFVPKGREGPLEDAREAMFQQTTGVRPLVFSRVKGGEGGVVRSELSCTLDDPCHDEHIVGELRALRTFIRAEL
jgi:hypothetical protein